MGNDTTSVRRRADRPSATPDQRSSAVNRVVAGYRNPDTRRFAQAYNRFLRRGGTGAEPNESDFDVSARVANSVRMRIENASRQGR